MSELNQKIARMKGIPTEHLPFQYVEGVTADGTDGWDGFYCPRCGSNKEDSECASNYEEDARLHMKLFEELPVGTRLTKYEEYCSGNIMYKCEIPDIETDISFTIGTAICSAYLEYRKSNIIEDVEAGS
jgi:hypothetical protein